ncbi:MAG: endo-1,4-beta-xylanase [Chloroflexi bacterium]|nr:endo-1,4-beta-xylanase [Chloroflexota bacterium]MBU1752218.1 endo-1,4-beta-xylanase [Chloroflexota bacterium]MBU1879021.1 endo-1,4-beta-xylanase [Chloroflexota bacterium]
MRAIRILSALSVLVVLLAALAMVTWQAMPLLAAQIAPPVTPTPRSRTIPDTDVNPYGANFFLEREVETWKIEKTLEMAREAGIVWAKQQFPWSEIQPKRSQFSWEKYDRLVAYYETYGLQVIARLDRPPDWSRKDNSYKQRPPDDYADYGEFVYAFVSHYKGRIRHIQVWNEPNIWTEWGNQAADPAAYTQLLQVAYEQAKRADPNVRVLSAPLAMNVEQGPRNLSDLDYLQGMYDAGAKDYFDILSANPFGFADPPAAPASPDTLNFGRVALLREIMIRNGDQNKAVWFNEYGWNAAPADFDPDRLIWKRVTEEQQAQYTIDGLHLAQAEWDWAGVFCYWYFRQVGDIPPAAPEYYFCMVDVDFAPRLVYRALEEMTTAVQVAGPGLIQESAPAVTTTGAWQTVVSDQASAGAYLTSEDPDASLVLAFEGGAVDLVTMRTPQSGILYVAVNGSPVPDLPKDARGRSFLDLYANPAEWQVRLPLVQGLSNGSYQLEITLSHERNPASLGTTAVIDGLVIRSGSPQPPPYGLVAALTLCLLLDLGWLIWELVRWRRPVPPAAPEQR